MKIYIKGEIRLVGWEGRPGDHPYRRFHLIYGMATWSQKGLGMLHRLIN